MSRLLASVLVLALCSSTVLAQPGQTPPAPPQQPYPQQPYPPQPYPAPAPAPAPAPGPYAPQPYQYQPQQVVQITAEEHELLMQGEISDGQIVGGGVLSLLVGFGVGQGVQGRWGDTGWIFTLGETASFAAMMIGAVSAIDDDDADDDDFEVTLIVGGAIGFVGFRLWEIVDAFAGPSSHNNRVRSLRMRLGYPAPMYGATPFVAPTKHGDGGVAGVTLRF